MNSRMEKYDSVDNETLSRQSRNEELYKTINKGELDNYEIKSNATILGKNSGNQIDVEQIKKILDTRYKETPRRSIRLDEQEETADFKQEETTKEYDINAILDKARNEKTIDYNEERIKKLRDTQFDILQSLHLPTEEKNEENTQSEENLMNLINTIAINEDKIKSKDSDEALDILADLKGEDNTEVFNGMKEELTEKNNEIPKVEEIKNDDKKISNETKNIKLDNSFYTKSMEFSKKDFDDIGIENDSTSIWIKILVVIVLLAFLAGLFFFLKSVLNF
jgi:hypothetical protein